MHVSGRVEGVSASSKALKRMTHFVSACGKFSGTIFILHQNKRTKQAPFQKCMAYSNLNMTSTYSELDRDITVIERERRERERERSL
jgi:hypothetical protein